MPPLFSTHFRISLYKYTQYILTHHIHLYSQKMKNLTPEDRQKILQLLLKQSKDGRVSYGYMNQMASKFGKSKRTIRRIWKQAKDASTESVMGVSSRRKGQVGRKKVQIDFNQVPQIPLRRRTNIRSLSAAMDVAKSTLHRRVQDGDLITHSNPIKPILTENNKKVRLQFCLSKIIAGTLFTQPSFDPMYNCIHVDEKWFYLSKESERYYLLPGESEPVRTCKSKKFIPKVMFLTVVARPRFDALGNETFNGKIGNFALVFKEAAKRRSKNREAGTLETKPIPSLTKDVYKSLMIEKVIPAIMEKWPASSSSEPISVQQDNAKPHISIDDKAGKRNGFNIRLTCQPPNSPDMNVLDLGFFRAIQTLQHQEAPKTIDELIDAVHLSFEQISSKSLNYVFLTLQQCMIEVMKVYGGNNYKVPHMKKNSLDMNNNLPVSLQCDSNIVQEAIRHLQNESIGL